MTTLAPTTKSTPTNPPTTRPLQESTTRPSSILGSNSSNISEIQKCLALLEEGKGKVSTNQTDIVFLLGITGSGKTTLVKFLATNNDHLQAEEVADNLGEYVINDSEQKISSSTLLSQTIFPELYIDPETQIPFYDGPGFSDTRGLATDIAGAHFVHKVISESSKIRFILTINYSSVRQGMDRGDFLELLQHVLHLVKNVDPYLESMGLVVTKVDNQMMKKDGELIMVPDEGVIDYIAKFLQDFKANIPKVVQGATAQSMTKLVNVLLRKKNSAYERIALFRRPDEAGPVSKIPLLQEGKAAIKRVVRDNLKPTIVHKEDFGYAISDESKNKLYEVLTAINENIAAEIGHACQSKILIYKAQSAESTDVYQLHNMLKADFEKLRDWLATNPDNSSLPEFLDDLLAVSQSLKAPFSQDEMNHVRSQGEYISFLETVNGKRFKDSAGSWKLGLQPFLNYLKENTSWSKYLTVLHTVLSSYPLQRKANNFAGLLEHPVTNINDAEFLKLLEFCITLNGELNGIQSVPMDSSKYQQLGRILEATLRVKTSAIYDESTDTLTIRGKFIRLGDHVNTQKNLTKVKFVNIFATEKIFIDTDFKRVNSNLQTLSLAAPIWEVIGDVHIKLDGEKGCCKPNYRGQDGDRFWRTGRNGSPGKPGKSGANFVGLVDTIVNREYLKISANGGQGAEGQDGGHGDNGTNGDSPIKQTPWGCSGSNFNWFKSKQLGGFFRRVYCVYGEPGDNGGDGGNGGIGGRGGLAGKIVFPLKQPLNVRTDANDGAAGTPGLAGEGGEGGKAGRSWNHQKMAWWWRDASCSRSKSLADEYGDCANTDFLRNGQRGHRGLAGANWDGVQMPQPTAIVDDAIIDRYSKFLQEEAKEDNINRSFKAEFLDKLGTIAKVSLRSSAQDGFVRMKRIRRYSPLDAEKPKWIRGDCFQAPQWPIIEKIGHSKATTEVSDTSLTSIPLTDMLLLADLLVRKLNQTRPNYLQTCTVDYNEVRACAVYILSTFEKLLAPGAQAGESLDIDSIVVMEKLEKEIINGSSQNITKILLDCFKNETPERKEELRRQLIAELELETSYN